MSSAFSNSTAARPRPLRGLGMVQLALVALCLGAASAWAANQTKVQLLLAAAEAKPGTTVQAGVRLEMPEGWHTYWLNPGESGMATEIKWELPAGVTAGAIQWPVPEKYEAEGLVTYVLHDEAILLVPLTLAPTVAPGSLDLKAKVSWLECEKQCVPGDGTVSARLVVGAENRPSPEAGALEKARLRLPAPAVKASAAWGDAAGSARPVTIEFDAPAGAKDPEFFPLPAESYEVAGATEVLPAAGATLKLRKQVKLSGAGKPWPSRLDGVLAATLPDGKVQAFAVSLSLGGAPAAAPAAAAAPPAQPAAAISAAGLLFKLFLAFVGGFILNIMPCVLPVLSLKILGFVGQGQSDPRQVRRLGLVYGAGVVASFLALALLVLAVNAAGGKASWGMQMQNAPFVVAMTTLVLLIALNLFGVFEVVLGDSAMNSASSLARREGAPGAFFNGVLATALATPCTAPFLGAAVGFAFTQASPLIILVTFLMVGVGMAFPYVLLSWHPAWLKFLPRPGVWMERFKKAMGFPMLATAAWLFSLAVEALGPDSPLWLAMFLVLAALAAWICGEFGQRAGKRGAVAVALLVMAAAYSLILEHQLHWRTPPEPAAAGTDTVQLHPGGIVWHRWSPEAVAAARAEKRPILVDFTASWCLTCQANAKTSIEIESVKQKLKELNAVALLENSFKKNARVIEELNRHGRAGVPLVLVYPRDPAKPAIVLPEALTPSIVLEALAKAAE